MDVLLEEVVELVVVEEVVEVDEQALHVADRQVALAPLVVLAERLVEVLVLLADPVPAAHAHITPLVRGWRECQAKIQIKIGLTDSPELLQDLADGHVDGRVGLVERDLLVLGLLVAVVLLEARVAFGDDLLTHALLVAWRELVARQPLQEVLVRDVTFTFAVVAATYKKTQL